MTSIRKKKKECRSCKKVKRSVREHTFSWLGLPVNVCDKCAKEIWKSKFLPAKVLQIYLS